MAKWSKKLLGLAAIGSAAAGLVYYLKKSKKNEDDDFNDDFEDEDFDLDNDLQPVDRGYVDLNAAKTTTEEDNAAAMIQNPVTHRTVQKIPLRTTQKILPKMLMLRTLRILPKTLTKTTGMTRINRYLLPLLQKTFLYPIVFLHTQV